MPIVKSVGKFRHIIRSWLSLILIGTKVSVRHLVGKKLVQTWSRDFEIGNLFWRGQFDHAFSLADINEGRAYFDSLLTFTDEKFDVGIIRSKKNEQNGHWFVPANKKRDATMLYLHGGGYGFYGEMSKRFAETLAGSLGLELFAPDYPLTPENLHPAQIDAAAQAYELLLAKGKKPEKIVVAGDSAGGHLALMLMIELKNRGLKQPALVIGMCPWTDIAARGDSLFGNDKYDLVQGYMVLEFGKWLKGNGDFSDEELSPIYQNFSGLAPIYLQGGGKEVLIDMIVDFAEKIAREDGRIMLDVWADMTHNFQSHGATLPQSKHALKRIEEAIDWRTDAQGDQVSLDACVQTKVNSI